MVEIPLNGLSCNLFFIYGPSCSLSFNSIIIFPFISLGYLFIPFSCVDSTEREMNLVISKVLNFCAKVKKYFSDHETRMSLYRGDIDVERGMPVEDTPLLHRFPVFQPPSRNPLTTITVAALLTILVLGVVIGLYLLIVLNNSGE